MKMKKILVCIGLACLLCGSLATGQSESSGQKTLASTMDVYVFPTEGQDAKQQSMDEAECYGWSNESYFSNPVWRNPDWRLPSGRYLVKVTVISSGEKCTGVYRLVNDVPQSDFRLEEAMPEDKVRD